MQKYLSATAEALGHVRESTLVPSTYSPHIAALPPTMSFFCSSVPIAGLIVIKNKKKLELNEHLKPEILQNLSDHASRPGSNQHRTKYSLDTMVLPESLLKLSWLGKFRKFQI